MGATMIGAVWPLKNNFHNESREEVKVFNPRQRLLHVFFIEFLFNHTISRLLVPSSHSIIIIITLIYLKELVRSEKKQNCWKVHLVRKAGWLFNVGVSAAWDGYLVTSGGGGFLGRST